MPCGWLCLTVNLGLQWRSKGVILHLASFLGMSSRELLVHKDCIRDCPFLQSPAPMILRRLASTNSFYYTNCCTGFFCNDGGPTNIERDLLPPPVVEEVQIARAMCLEEFNLLLSLALILSSSILTWESLLGLYLPSHSCKQLCSLSSLLSRDSVQGICWAHS